MGTGIHSLRKSHDLRACLAFGRVRPLLTAVLTILLGSQGSQPGLKAAEIDMGAYGQYCNYIRDYHIHPEERRKAPLFFKEASEKPFVAFGVAEDDSNRSRRQALRKLGAKILDAFKAPKSCAKVGRAPQVRISLYGENHECPLAAAEFEARMHKASKSKMLILSEGILSEYPRNLDYVSHLNAFPLLIRHKEEDLKKPLFGLEKGALYQFVGILDANAGLQSLQENVPELGQENFFATTVKASGASTYRDQRLFTDIEVSYVLARPYTPSYPRIEDLLLRLEAHPEIRKQTALLKDLVNEAGKVDFNAGDQTAKFVQDTLRHKLATLTYQEVRSLMKAYLQDFMKSDFDRMLRELEIGDSLRKEIRDFTESGIESGKFEEVDALFSDILRNVAFAQNILIKACTAEAGVLEVSAQMGGLHLSGVEYLLRKAYPKGLKVQSSNPSLDYLHYFPEQRQHHLESVVEALKKE
jgi:hypothetical protein